MTETGYVGVTIHTAARVMAAAHGGQVLVSGATHTMVGTGPHLSFLSLGSYQLRGLADEDELLQIKAKGLISEFPPPAV